MSRIGPDPHQMIPNPIHIFNRIEIPRRKMDEGSNSRKDKKKLVFLQHFVIFQHESNGGGVVG